MLMNWMQPGLMDFAFDDQVQFQDEGAGLPQAEPFPTGAQQQRSSSQAAEDEDSESAEAAMQRRHRPVRRTRALPFDQVQELRSAELTGWQQNYTANMAGAQQLRDQHRAPFLAKKKAFDWVLGSGIGGVGDAFPSSHENNPLNIFKGDSMLEMITGVRPDASRKRSRDEESVAGTDSETRRKRLQEDEGGEIGRGEIPPFQDDDMGFQASDVSPPLSLSRRLQVLNVRNPRTSKSAATAQPPSQTTQPSPGTPLPPPSLPARAHPSRFAAAINPSASPAASQPAIPLRPAVCDSARLTAAPAASQARALSAAAGATTSSQAALAPSISSQTSPTKALVTTMTMCTTPSRRTGPPRGWAPKYKRQASGCARR